MFSSFPILTRAYRTQWRNRHFFVLLFALTGFCALIFGWSYADSTVSFNPTRDINERLGEVGRNLWWILAWLQTALALLVPPALGAGTIARERERGLLDSLLMAPIEPARIVFEKWLGTIAPLLLLFLVLLPFNVIANLLQSQDARALFSVLGFQLLLMATSAAIGLACSAWARRAHLALRSAYGLIILWVLGSGGAAFLSGTSALGTLIPGYVAPLPIRLFGLTNPILGAADLIWDDASQNYWPGAIVALVGLLVLCAWSATRALRKPLAQAPFIGDSQKSVVRKKRGQNASVSGHFEVPIIGALRFANPVLGREFVSKFRMRQPPVGVIVFEAILALLVAYFYARTLWTAFTDPSVRGIIFGGVAVTGLIVTLLSCTIMGANGFSREHESGTWESLRLSLLRPREIIRGKAVGIGLICLLFSIPIWPLLLPCVNWGQSWESSRASDTISISFFVATIVIWLGSAATATMWGLWWGRRTRKTSAASGAALASGALWFAGVPLVTLILGSGRATENILMWINPFGALINSNFYIYGNASALALPFLAFSLAFTLAVAALLERAMKREFG